jgi:cephalosporin hydroxylase
MAENKRSWWKRKKKKINNAFVDKFRPRISVHTDSAEMAEIMERARKRTDISDYLPDLFIETLSVAPKFIVELGVRDGESLFAFERAARLCGSTIASVDIEDCSSVCSYGKWHFVQKSDIEFPAEFSEWCRTKNIGPAIDLLFIDTSHLYEHTVEEIRLWFPFLSGSATVIFHDTNLQDPFFRKDGSMEFSWDNQRGVIRAVEEYFRVSFNEKTDFTTIIGGWIIRHQAHCNGLTVLKKLDFK